MGRAETLALVGAVGGAGTTRLCVEFAALLARDGRDVAVFDAAYATQGLADHVGGRIDPDVTALCTDATDQPVEAGLYDAHLDAPGRVAYCPAFAPFERVARAKTPEAARRFAERVGEASEAFDHVFLDVPPVAANQSLGAVDAADRVAVVAPDTGRGTDALPRMVARLRDVDSPATVEIANRGDGDEIERAMVTVPEGPTEAAAAPAVLRNGAFTVGVGRAVQDVLDVELSVNLADMRPPGLRERFL
ncbi:ParA family protein [Salinirubellus sp. GCM10025818]|uniref:ParA family protein n=1 Tax=Salinirubellus TaxID=2162630 RepID=UPI0030D0F39E